MLFINLSIYFDYCIDEYLFIDTVITYSNPSIYKFRDKYLMALSIEWYQHLFNYTLLKKTYHTKLNIKVKRYLLWVSVRLGSHKNKTYS